MVTRKPTFESYDIGYALQAIRHFVEENNGGDTSILKDSDVVNITICWREGTNYEWTPCASGFRRINFMPPKEFLDWKFVAVFGYDHWGHEIGEKLTNELNAAIMRFTNWKPPE